MLLAAASALSFSTLARARAEAQSARLSYAQTEGRLRQAQTENVRLQVEIKELRENPRTAERLAQDRLNYVRPNEIVISVR
jgi:cell division protein FtsB